jgi:hypothetical protein
MSRPESEDRTGDARPVSPGAKALGAMELAARRARESRDAGTAHDHDPRTPTGFDHTTAWRQHEATDPRASAPSDAETGSQRRAISTVPPERWLAVAVGVAALLVVAAAVALVVSLTSSGSSPGRVAAEHTGTATHAGATGNRTAGGTGAESSGSPSAPQSTTSTLPSLGTPGGAPVISSLSPTSGSSGQTLQVAGSNFLSSDGQIVATFAGQVAPTSCPSQNTCTVTVPPSSGPPGRVPVTITTSGGTSNTVTFTYR